MRLQVKRNLIIVAIALLLLGFIGFVAKAQPYQGQPPSYAIGYQRVLIPGDYIAAQRALPCLTWALGPRVYFIPRPVQPQPPAYQQPLPGPVQPQGAQR